MNTGAKLESPNTILPPNRARTLAIAASATEDPAVMAVAADIQRLRSDSDDAAERLRIMPLLIPPPGKHVENCGDSHDPRHKPNVDGPNCEARNLNTIRPVANFTVVERIK